MKFNDLVLKGYEESELNLILNEINTTQTIFKNRFDFISLSEYQKTIQEVISSVYEILDFNKFQIDLHYSLIYKEIFNLAEKGEISLLGRERTLSSLYSELIYLVRWGYFDTSGYYGNQYKNILNHIGYLKKLGVSREEIIGFIDSLNLEDVLGKYRGLERERKRKSREGYYYERDI